MTFDGATYEPEADKKRLTAQLDIVRDLMSDHKWWTLAQLSDAVWKAGCMASQASLSSRIRDLRKPRFGWHRIERRRIPDSGTWQYRLLADREAKLLAMQANLVQGELEVSA